MKNIWKWVLVFVLVAVVFFALPFIFPAACPYYGGMGWSGYPMMRGFGMMPFGMLFIWLIPLGTLFLLVFGILWLVNHLTGTGAPARTCTRCGKSAQADWKTCPYCGNAL